MKATYYTLIGLCAMIVYSIVYAIIVTDGEMFSLFLLFFGFGVLLLCVALTLLNRRTIKRKVKVKAIEKRLFIGSFILFVMFLILVIYSTS